MNNFRTDIINDSEEVKSREVSTGGGGDGLIIDNERRRNMHKI